MEEILQNQTTNSRVLEALEHLVEEKWNVVFMSLTESQTGQLRDLQAKIFRENSNLRQIGALRGKIRMATRVHPESEAGKAQTTTAAIEEPDVEMRSASDDQRGSMDSDLASEEDYGEEVVEQILPASS